MAAHLTPAQRKALGAHYTPIDVATDLVAWALDGWASPSLRTLDPACGAGAFLLAVRALRPDADLVGVDVDPGAVESCRASLPEATVVLADGLAPLDAEPALGPGSPATSPPAFDLVVGNPPFLGQLAAATSRDRTAQARLRERFGPAVTGYVDTAALFLLAALDAVRPGGRVVLILPDSVLGAAHTGAVRAEVEDRADVLGVRPLPPGTFTAASVDACAVLVERRSDARRGEVRREEAQREGSRRRDIRGPTWSPRLADALGIPAVGLGGEGTVGDLATATAGFRQHHYALAAHVVEHGGSEVPVLTTGLVDPGRVLWGERPARIGGRRWERPAVDLTGVRADDPAVGSWFDARLRPKVLVAPQTKVVEAAVDPDGRFLPATPLVAVEPRDDADLWLLLAALSAPPVSAWAATLTVGTARSRSALKLSARQVLSAPLPVDEERWRAAADRLADGATVADVAEAMTLAHGLPAADPVLAWWRARLPFPR